MISPDLCLYIPSKPARQPDAFFGLHASLPNLHFPARQLPSLLCPGSKLLTTHPVYALASSSPICQPSTHPERHHFSMYDPPEGEAIAATVAASLHGMLVLAYAGAQFWRSRNGERCLLYLNPKTFLGLWLVVLIMVGLAIAFASFRWRDPWPDRRPGLWVALANFFCMLSSTCVEVR